MRFFIGLILTLKSLFFGFAIFMFILTCILIALFNILGAH